MPEHWRYVHVGEIDVPSISRGPLPDVGSPIKVPEYLALGVPVVCNDNPDQQWIIESSGAGRCVPYKAESFAAATLELLKLDASARHRMVERCRSFIQQHRSYEVISTAVAATYLRVNA